MARFPFYNQYKWGYTKEFHRHFKCTLHSMGYGNAKAREEFIDFIHAYIAGGEL